MRHVREIASKKSEGEERGGRGLQRDGKYEDITVGSPGPVDPMTRDCMIQ